MGFFLIQHILYPNYTRSTEDGSSCQQLLTLEDQVDLTSKEFIKDNMQNEYIITRTSNSILIIY